MNSACRIQVTLSTLVITGALLFVISSQAIAGQPDLPQLSGDTMGTTWNVTVDADLSKAELQQLRDDIVVRLGEINARMSTYLPDSEVSRFNASTQTDWFDVSSETAKVVQRSMEIHKATEGAFDITVMPLVELWGFGPGRAERTSAVPDDKKISELLLATGSDKLQVRLQPPALKKSVPQLQIDLSAIAKGYAVDEVAALIVRHNHASYLVEIGGEIRVGNAKREGTKWLLGIEKPVAGIREIESTVLLENRAMASSGNYRNFFQQDGKHYGHTIDPRTGRPAISTALAASVVAPDCMTADAFATACMVLGDESTELLSVEPQIATLLIHDDNGRLATKADDRFPPIESPLAGAEHATSHSLAVTNVTARNALAGDAQDSAGFWPMFAAVAIVLLIAVFAMSIGVILSGKRIKGSCGALASSGTDVSSPCDLCSKPVKDCPEKQAAASG